MPAKQDDQSPTSAPLSRTERKKQKRLAKLLKTATLVFGEKGYDKTSLEDIAERMDMRGPSLYHYVKTKEDLFIQCAEKIITRNLKNLEDVQLSEGSPIERLEKMYYVQILGQLDEFYPSHIPLFVTMTSREPNLIAYLTKIRKKHIKYFRDLAEEAVEAGEIQGDNWQLGLRLAAGALGSLHQWYSPTGKDSAEVMAGKIAKSFIKLIRE